jgi:hypothetical protein
MNRMNRTLTNNQHPLVFQWSEMTAMKDADSGTRGADSDTTITGAGGARPTDLKLICTGIYRESAKLLDLSRHSPKT